MAEHLWSDRGPTPNTLESGEEIRSRNFSTRLLHSAFLKCLPGDGTAIGQQLTAYISAWYSHTALVSTSCSDCSPMRLLSAQLNTFSSSSSSSAAVSSSRLHRRFLHNRRLNIKMFGVTWCFANACFQSGFMVEAILRFRPQTTFAAVC